MNDTHRLTPFREDLDRLIIIGVLLRLREWHPGHAPGLPSEIAKACQRAQQDVKCEENLSLAIDPLGDALQEDGADGEEKADTETMHHFGRASPQKLHPHQKPTEPHESESQQTQPA